jgi:hypothetical protein
MSWDNQLIVVVVVLGAMPILNFCGVELFLTQTVAPKLEVVPWINPAKYPPFVSFSEPKAVIFKIKEA